MPANARRVLTFYKFLELAEPDKERDEVEGFGDQIQLKGTILLAAEGINGTVIAAQDGLEKLVDFLQQRYGKMTFKWSAVNPENRGFLRFKVKVKPEIVSFGVSDLDMSLTGEHVNAERWNELVDDPNVLVIDTRNHYEIDIGTFEQAVSPETESFREFPQWVEENLDPGKHQKVAMFCTGGIRCEKASAYVRAQGIEEVFQLDGGILQYLEDTESTDSRWQGECFVFDQRVSVDENLVQGQYQQCYACRHPLTEVELAGPEFERGVSCVYCLDLTSADRRVQFRERQRQVRLAAEQGRDHIGYNPKKKSQ
jgi:UPF0176 protein